MTSVDTIPKQDSPPSRRHQRRIDLALGIALGVILGIAVVAAFVFYGSEGSVDAPRISGVDTGKPARHAPAVPGTATTGAPRSPLSSH